MKFLKKILNFFRRSKPEDREKGAITVAETLIALGVGATILAVVFAGIPALTAARDASNGQNGLAQLSTAVRSTFGARGDFTGLTTELATNLAGFPQHFRAGAGVIHPWGGAVTVAPDATNPRRFTVTFEDVPGRGCTTIATATLALATQIQIGTTVVDLAATDDPSTNNVDESLAANIAGLCTAAATANIIWTFSA